jgi:hypothetical protein
MNQQLLSQSHSSIVKSLQASAEQDPFVYGVSESMPPISKSVVEVAPVRAVAGETAQDLQFNLPRNGFLTKAILLVSIEAVNPFPSDTKNNWSSRCLDECSLRARGVELRKANFNSFVADAIDNENNSVQSHSRKLIGLHSQNPTATTFKDFAYDVSSVLGFSCDENNKSLQNAIDTLFCEDLTINVSLKAMADIFFAAGDPNNQVYTNAVLVCQYQQMTSSEYDSFKSKNYSASEPTRRLIRYHEAEQPQKKGDTVAADTDLQVNIRYKGLVRKINVHWWIRDKANANNGGQSCTIVKMQLYGSGSLLWEAEGDVNKLFLCPSLVRPAGTRNGIDNGLNDATGDHEFGMQVIDFSNVSANSDKSSFINGCLNTGDLTNVYLNIQRAKLPTGAAVIGAAQVDIDLEVYSMENISGDSGLVSVSSKE